MAKLMTMTQTEASTKKKKISAVISLDGQIRRTLTSPKVFLLRFQYFLNFDSSVYHAVQVCRLSSDRSIALELFNTPKFETFSKEFRLLIALVEIEKRNVCHEMNSKQNVHNFLFDL